MSTTPCPHDAAVTQAVRNGTWTPALRAHVDTCPDCRQSTALVEQLALLAATTAAAAPPPRSPHALWLRAEFAQRARERSRLTRLRLSTGAGALVLALTGFTLIRGTAGWVRLAQIATTDSRPDLTMAIVAGMAIAAWVMLASRTDERSFPV